jgi:Na+-driven multidrug efflux pump
VAKLAYQYILIRIPGHVFYGLTDIQKKYLILIGRSKDQMNAQIAACFVHAFFNYLFVNHLEMGVLGSGMASNLTNVFLLICNYILTARLKKFKEAHEVSIFDKRVWR